MQNLCEPYFYKTADRGSGKRVVKILEKQWAEPSLIVRSGFKNFLGGRLPYDIHGKVRAVKDIILVMVAGVLSISVNLRFGNKCEIRVRYPILRACLTWELHSANAIMSAPSVLFLQYIIFFYGAAGAVNENGVLKDMSHACDTGLQLNCKLLAQTFSNKYNNDVLRECIWARNALSMLSDLHQRCRKLWITWTHVTL